MYYYHLWSEERLFCWCTISTSNRLLPQSVNPYEFINTFLGHEAREFSELPSPPYLKDFYNIIGLSTNGQSSFTFSLATQRFLPEFQKMFQNFDLHTRTYYIVSSILARRVLETGKRYLEIDFTFQERTRKLWVRFLLGLQLILVQHCWLRY